MWAVFAVGVSSSNLAFRMHNTCWFQQRAVRIKELNFSASFQLMFLPMRFKETLVFNDI